MKVLDTNLLFAVRCANCGRIKFHSISTFDFMVSNKIELHCDCGCTELTVCLKDNRTIFVEIPCIACDSVHTYRYNLKDILRRRVTVICCSETDFELCFLGKDKDIKDIVYKYQEDINELMNELGLMKDAERFF